MQVLSKSKATAGSGIQQREREAWRKAYRQARMVARLERDFSLGLSTLRCVYGCGISVKAHTAQLGVKKDRLHWKIGSPMREINGPVGRLP